MRLRIVTIVCLSFFFGVIGVLWVVKGRKAEEEDENSRRSRQSGLDYSLESKGATSTCHMITTFQTDSRGRFTPVSCTMISPGAPPLAASQIPSAQLENLKYMLKLCQKGD